MLGLWRGDVGLALSISLFFELFWVDLIPAGTFIPPEMTAAAVAAVALAQRFGLDSPPLALLAILAAMPLAYLGQVVESQERSLQDQSHEALLAQASDPEGDFAPQRLVYAAMRRFAALHFGIFCICLGLLFVLFQAALPVLGLLSDKSQLTWWHIWFGATIGGLLSIRLRSGYAMLATASGVALLAAMFWR